MTDDLDLLRSFRAEVPLPDAATTERVRSLVAGRPRRVARVRPRLALALAVAALAVATGAVAAIQEGPWWNGGSPPVDPQAVASVARDNLPAKTDLSRARTVARDGEAALVAVPIQESGYCLIPTLDGRGDLGAQCEYQVRNPEAGDDDRLVSLPHVSPAGDRSWLVYGRVTDPRAAAVDLGALTVKLEPGGFFVALVPAGDWARLSGTANRGTIEDGSGASLRSGCVNWGTAPGDGAQGDITLWTDAKGPCRPLPSPPAMPTLSYSDAQTLFAVTLVHPYSIWKAGDTIRFERVRSTAGAECVVAVADGFHPAHGGDCTRPAGAQALSPQLDAQLVHDGGERAYVWSVEGRAAANVARVELRSPSGTVSIAFAGGYFFAQLGPTTPTADHFPPGPYVLIAYDAGGAAVASVDLNEELAQAQPH
jgi:hypothetical protein